MTGDAPYKVYKFIEAYQLHHLHSPMFKEIRAQVGLSTDGLRTVLEFLRDRGVLAHVYAERRGWYIPWLPNQFGIQPKPNFERNPLWT